MKKSNGNANDRKNPTKNEDAPISDLESQIHKAHPLIQSYISELKKEIARLHKQNTKQEVAHFSALEKLKAEHAEQMKAKPMIAIVTAEDAHTSSKS
mgnify:CR=1 FL=1